MKVVRSVADYYLNRFEQTQAQVRDMSTKLTFEACFSRRWVNDAVICTVRVYPLIMIIRYLQSERGEMNTTSKSISVGSSIQDILV